MERIQLKALGKINLGLDVLGKRENGYHDVRMIMQTVYLYDEVTLEKRQKPGITVSTNLIYLPTDKTNIAYRAAKILLDEFGERRGVAIHLKKHIPVAAGMAGGSADAAAVLFGMNRMFGWKLSEKELMERGVTLGADVPYCIMRGTALAEGIGEKLTRLPAMPKCHLLIAKPPISVSTKLVYEKLDALAIVDHPDIDGIIEGLKDRDLIRVAGSMGNVLQNVTETEYPVITQIKEKMIKGGAINAMMSGSGPTVFGFFKERSMAKKTAEQIRQLGLARQIYTTTIHNVRKNRGSDEWKQISEQK
ncbi:4-(cytidine 5'-diphospho)-2-C-methyl-D-erythritol kinase [Sellimonas intestinalis]|uniref:4-diphosphocytidyl-2-C-methyl-D-erythritol kinase n=1 Tax=Sellimonas intestinalis TaxID=1653434 RepID=A0A3E3K4B2_9FIRM|nr:4-(cytidine 5'-diphospho)-2-C-methyl-D-erythritol kinase [Sellimonas intestinalis]RGE88311.1 4-(cytidine 5'-diphospho)-2-C-methyl-D-erythritol kinase [Sellimonas intestinalis]RGE88793.1 4-(cytidine 5'-diphospho)-2-C-methyl-D-erythritol kinase [Sellimonas intestinalis]